MKFYKIIGLIDKHGTPYKKLLFFTGNDLFRRYASIAKEECSAFCASMWLGSGKAGTLKLDSVLSLIQNEYIVIYSGPSIINGIL